MLFLFEQFSFSISEDGENWEDRPPNELLVKWSHIHDIIGRIVAIMPM